MFKKCFKLLGILCIALALTGCGSPEEKKMKFFSKGQALYEEGDYVKARLEFKNALQIDPKFADGYYMLGLVEQRAGNLKNAYASLKKAVALDPDLMDAQLQMGKLLFLSRAADPAMEKVEIVLAKEPDNSEALLLKGSLLMAQNDAAGAIKLLE
ncbi:MAG: tetratricopeptide repeat protein, partial [Desulfobacterales bacterium]|nr:tetratricopeptide repeat protein [Desulfobacterales bacterium]